MLPNLGTGNGSMVSVYSTSRLGNSVWFSNSSYLFSIIGTGQRMTFLWIDTETTGLDHKRHQIVELTYALGNDDPYTLVLPHSLTNADPDSLRINKYYERGLDHKARWATVVEIQGFARLLYGAKLAGSNPRFDADFLSAKGYGGWHHRLMDVPLWAAGRLGLPESLGLAKTVLYMRQNGYDIPLPDHTATNDVLAVRAVYTVLFNQAPIKVKPRPHSVII